MRFSIRRFSVVVIVLSTTSAFASAERPIQSPNADLDPPMISWQPPAKYALPRISGIHPLNVQGDISNLLPFIAVTPCRQYDSRNFTPLLQATPRMITLTGAPCNIASVAQAVAVNITVFNIIGATGNAVFDVGTTSPPSTAWLNYPPTEAQRGNAGVVPLNGSGQIVVEVFQGGGQVDFTVDIYGYYSETSSSNGQFRLVNNSGLATLDVVNNSNSCVSCAIDAEALGTGGTFNNPQSAIFAFGGSGVSIGVWGASGGFGDGSFGVFGEDETNYFPPASVLTFRGGVRGSSRDAIGVVGQSRNNCVVGQLRDNADSPTFYGILGATFGTAADTTVGPWGVFSGGNFGATGTKHFVEPHPTDPKKVILYSTVEGRTVDTTFRGTARLVDHTAVIEVPEDFRIVTDEEGVTVQITPVGAYSQIYVESQDLNRIVVRGSRDVQFHYQVTGLRRAFKDLQPVQIGYVFMPQSPGDRMPLYLTEEARRRLISNGTYNEDGTVNMATAEKAGFTRIWAERKAQAEAAAQETRRPADTGQR